MPIVTLRVLPGSAQLRVARMVAAAVARVHELPESKLEDIRLATGEICSRALTAHEELGIADPVVVEIEVSKQVLVVRVADLCLGAEPVPGATDRTTSVSGPGPVPEGHPMWVASAAADRLEARTSPTGTVVEMSWAFS